MSIIYLPYDMLYTITLYLDYKSYFFFKKVLSNEFNIENNYFDKKINIIKNFIKKSYIIIFMILKI